MQRFVIAEGGLLRKTPQGNIKLNSPGKPAQVFMPFLILNGREIPTETVYLDEASAASEISITRGYGKFVIRMMSVVYPMDIPKVGAVAFNLFVSDEVSLERGKTVWGECVLIREVGEFKVNDTFTTIELDGETLRFYMFGMEVMARKVNITI